MVSTERCLFSLHRQVVTSQCTGHGKLKIQIVIDFKPSHNNQAAFQSNSSRSYRQTQILLPGGTPIYEPFWYVSPPRVGSLRRFGLKTGMFTEELQLCINELVESIPGE